MIMILQFLRRAAVLVAAAIGIAAYSSTFAAASPYGAQQLVGAWEGSYYCNEDYQLATIKIWESGGQLVGTFSFRPSPGRRGYVGSYEFVVQQRGEEIMFLPTRWIQRPRGIEMAPSTVKFRTANRLDGRLEHRACGGISLNRVQVLQEIEAINKTPSDPAVAGGADIGALVTVSVPGLGKAVTAPLGVPLSARWSMAQHPLVKYATRYDADPPLPGFEWVAPAGDPRQTQYGSGTFILYEKPFLPMKEVSTVSLFYTGDEVYRRGGLYVHTGEPTWPTILNGKAVVWGIDGYAFSAGGGTANNMVRYMTERSPSQYVYVEYYIRNKAECGPYVGCQMNLVTDSAGHPYSQAMILTLASVGRRSTLRILASAEAQDGSGAAFARGAGRLLVTGLLLGLVAELSRPLEDRLREDRERCLRDRAMGLPAIC